MTNTHATITADAELTQPLYGQAAPADRHVVPVTDGARGHDEPRLGNSCTVYPGLCTSVDGEDGDAVDANGRHIDHGGRTISVPGLEVEGDPEIWANFTHLSDGTPHIGFMGYDLTPDQTRVKAEQLRRMAKDMDTLADQVEAAEKAHTANVVTMIRERQATAAGPLAEALDAMANLVEKTGDPDAVAELVLGVTARPLADQR